MVASNRIAQAYGYAVCLIAVITILISSSNIVRSLFDLSDPLRAEGFNRGVSLTSYPAYKREQAQRAATPTRVPPGRSDSTISPPATETELRQQFEDERVDQIGNVRFRSMKSLVGNALMIVVALGLFMWHWRWLRREDLKA